MNVLVPGIIITVLCCLLLYLLRKIVLLRREIHRQQDILARQQVTRAEYIKKQMDISILQNQINPHFLYNTLEAIRSQAILNDEDEIAAELETLSNYFRYINHKQGKSVHLFEELQNIQDYYTIIRFRFFDRVKIRIQIDDPMILQAMLPHLTLQPIVENAINHGLRDVTHNGLITITASASDDSVRLFVSDNGCGMTEKQLYELDTKIHTDPVLLPDAKQGHGVALPNVHHRIQLMFGDHYGLNIQSLPGMGTDVCINIPLDDRSH